MGQDKVILNSRFVQLERHEAGADWKPYQEISRGLADISGYIIGVPATIGLGMVVNLCQSKITQDTQEF